MDINIVIILDVKGPINICLLISRFHIFVTEVKIK